MGALRMESAARALTERASKFQQFGVYPMHFLVFSSKPELGRKVTRRNGEIRIH